MLSWRELPPWMKLLRSGAVVGWSIFMGSLVTVGAIETAALRQPAVADAHFNHPHDIKGTVRFFSDRQEQVYVVAKPLMLGSFAVSAVLFGSCKRLEESREKRKKQKQLEQLSQRLSEQETRP
jgi:hypothetical protein